MAHSLRRWLAAGAVAAAMLGAGSVSAAPVTAPEHALARAAAAAYPGEAYAQYRRGPGGGAVAAGVIGGLAVGALVGSALAAPPPAYGPPPAPAYGPPPGPAYAYGPPPPPPGAVPVGNVYGRDPYWVQYCARTYPGFDPISGTFVGRDGYRYPCR